MTVTRFARSGYLRFLAVCLLGCCVVGVGRGAQSAEPVTVDPPAPPVTTLPPVTVQATAIPGLAVDGDAIPANVQTLSSSDLTRHGAPSLTGALNRQLSSISVNDNLEDPFQPDILYRGFEASPVLGTPQGLAVYQNGVRINEAFGDTVNWDLLPAAAIDRISIESASPVYGLNALGGGLSVTMKDGFGYSGASAEISGGSFGRRMASVQFGRHRPGVAVYVAGNALDEDGWREFSSDRVRQLYAALSARADAGSLQLSYTGADNHLSGQGAAPVQELAVDRSLVFTGPQINWNRVSFLTLNGSIRLAGGWSLQGVLYRRQYWQQVANGNTTDAAACTSAALPGQLCQRDGLTPLTNAAGQPLPDISDGGSVPIGENDPESINSDGQGAALQASQAASWWGRLNDLSFGITLDEASVQFQSRRQPGTISPQLIVQPSNLEVVVPEDSAFTASPVALHAFDRYYGAYLTDTWRASSALALTVSARYNVARVQLHDRRGTELSGDSQYVHLNPAIGATYRVLPHLTTYVGYSQNARAPTPSEIECSDPLRPCLLPSSLSSDPPNLRQVVARTLELGVRGRNALWEWNADLFRTSLENDIYGVATSISSGFFQNIGATRRQGIEAGVQYAGTRWSSYLNYSFIDATFESALMLPAAFNPESNAGGIIEVVAGDRLPGIPRHRLKLGTDLSLPGGWSVGASMQWVSNQYYFGDASNQNAPLPGHVVTDLHGSYRANRHLLLFMTVDNLFDAHYATYGIFGDPTGVGAPGVPAGAVTNGAGIDNRFESPAAPVAVYGGVRVTL